MKKIFIPSLLIMLIASTQTIIAKTPIAADSIVLRAGYDFPVLKVEGYHEYVKEADKSGDFWCLQIPDPSTKTNSFAAAQTIFKGQSSEYLIILNLKDEDDGQNIGRVKINGKLIGDSIMTSFTDDAWHDVPVTWSNVKINTGDTIQVETKVHSNDGKEYGRGRWTHLILKPATPRIRTKTGK